MPTREDDALPFKSAKPRQGGPADGMYFDSEELEQIKTIYYAMCGWDQQGIPPRAKLGELGLDWLAEAIGV
ncbi:MAG: aldehyde ferredoxin oxidoreductase C-terminal domain-containing protein [Ardenticatenaceae bacterium]|nr:aldehyde ferredoxin oxidoreductase C-terminal domain-containing protein [Ardenticatenaceae bacterium]